MERAFTGILKWFNTAKGYGFITPDDGSADVFVHIAEVQKAGLRNLSEGQKIAYNLERGRSGKYSAIDLEKA